MKKLVSLMMSVVVLTFSIARSTQAQGLLNFTPKAEKSTVRPQPVKSQSVEQSVVQSTPKPTEQTEQSAAIAFDTSEPTRSTTVPPIVRSLSSGSDRLVAVASDELFEGGSDSLVAKAVGSAEGTRTPDGGRTWAYRGHVDPGNGRWNMGSFSYQHGATSPDDADRKQLDRLRGQYEVIRAAASSSGLRLGLEEQLNGIDLANQAPLAALDRGGYIDRLRQAYAQGLRGSEAVLHARVYSYINPRTNRWDAPGLGNNVYSISQDQARRQTAIAQAVNNHQQVARRKLRDRDDMKVSRVPE